MRSNTSSAGTPSDQQSGISSFSPALNQGERSNYIPSARRLDDLPHEILLAIIARIHCDPRSLTALNLTNRFFHNFLVTQKASLLREFLVSQFSFESFIFRPSFPDTSSSPSATWLRDLAINKHGARTLVDVCLTESQVAAQAVEVLGEETWRTIATLGLHLANWRPPPRPDLTIWRLSFINTMPLALVYAMRLTCAMLADTLSSSNVLDWTISGFSDMKDYMDDLHFYTENWLCKHGWSSFEVLLAPRTTSPDSQETPMQAAEVKRNEQRGEFVGYWTQVIKNATSGIETSRGLKLMMKYYVLQKVEGQFGRKPSRELDFAVIDWLQEEGLDSKAMLEMFEQLVEKQYQPI